MGGPLVLNDAAGATTARRADVARVRLIEEIAYNDWRSDWRATLFAHSRVPPTRPDLR